MVAISATPHQEDYMSRADLAGRISTVEHRMDSIEQRLDASFAALSTQILQSNRETRDTILATLRSEMAAMGGSLATKLEVRDEGVRTRRHFDVVAESLEGSISLVAEGHLALGQQMTKLEANLSAGFETRNRTTELVLHDHGRRLIVLETPKS